MRITPQGLRRIIKPHRSTVNNHHTRKRAKNIRRIMTRHHKIHPSTDHHPIQFPQHLLTQRVQRRAGFVKKYQFSPRVERHSKRQPRLLPTTKFLAGMPFVAVEPHSGKPAGCFYFRLSTPLAVQPCQVGHIVQTCETWYRNKLLRQIKHPPGAVNLPGFGLQ